MIKSALEYLVKLGQVKTLEINGQVYSTDSLYHVSSPKVNPMKVNTLNGLIDYIKSDFDKEYFRGNLIHVASYDEVRLISNILYDAGREGYIVADALQPEFSFGRFYGIENFIIAMQSCFIRNEDASKILKVVGNIKEENIRQLGDDGVTQSVTAKAGIATVAEVPVPNPVALAPYRTFIEIEQPESSFVFRMRSGDQGPECALFEADGGAWRLEAMKRIKEYLETELVDTDIKIIA